MRRFLFLIVIFCGVILLVSCGQSTIEDETIDNITHSLRHEYDLPYAVIDDYKVLDKDIVRVDYLYNRRRCRADFQLLQGTTSLVAWHGCEPNGKPHVRGNAFVDMPTGETDDLARPINGTYLAVQMSAHHVMLKGPGPDSNHEDVKWVSLSDPDILSATNPDDPGWEARASWYFLQ